MAYGPYDLWTLWLVDLLGALGGSRELSGAFGGSRELLGAFGGSRGSSEAAGRRTAGTSTSASTAAAMAGAGRAAAAAARAAPRRRVCGVATAAGVLTATAAPRGDAGPEVRQPTLDGFGAFQPLEPDAEGSEDPADDDLEGGPGFV